MGKGCRSTPLSVILSTAGSSQLTMHIMTLNGLAGQTRPSVPFQLWSEAVYNIEPSVNNRVQKTPGDYVVCVCVCEKETERSRPSWLQPSGQAGTHLETCFIMGEYRWRLSERELVCQHVCVCVCVLCVCLGVSDVSSLNKLPEV